MRKLSAETIRRVNLLFRADDREAAKVLLQRECGNNLVGFEYADESELERIRFAALKVSNGSLQVLSDAIELAKQDWRDLLIGAEFGEDPHVHRRWLAND
jgi:hypothetical protein